MIIKRDIKGKGLGITLTNNEIKLIVNLINSLENRGILVKVTTEKAVNQTRRIP